MNRRILPLLALVSSVLPQAQRVMAATIPEPGTAVPVTQVRVTSLSDSLTTIWSQVSSIVYPILGGIAVLYLIHGGIQYITSGGNADKIKKARQQIYNVIFGIALLVSSYTIISVILGLANTAANVAAQ